MKATTAHGRLFYLVLLVSAGLSFWIVVAGLFALAIGTLTSSTARAQDAPVEATPRAGTWSRTGNLSTPRQGHAATVLRNGEVLVSGGYSYVNYGVVPVESAEVYNPATGRWRQTGRMTAGRYGHTASLLHDGRVLVAGGGDRAAEIFDPASGTWSRTGVMAEHRHDHGATVLHDGRVLVAGGAAFSSIVDFEFEYFGFFSGNAFDSVEVYDPNTGTWASTGSMTYPRTQFAMTPLPTGKVLVAGGYSGTYASADAAELYDPASGTWSLTSGPQLVMAGLSATLLPSGQALLVGGTVSALFDPATERMRIEALLEGNHSPHTASLLPDGQVLVVGGTRACDGTDPPIDIVEAYDPRNRAWNRIVSPSICRSGHTASLLPTGQLLVAGGIETFASFDYVSSRTTDVAELYTSAPVIDAGYTGAWFDPAQSGHGIVLEVLPDRRVHAQWFTFNPAGDQQAWFGGTGTYSGNVATIDNVVLPTGGRWIPNFDPATVVLNPLGTLTLTFSDHDHGSAEFSLGRGYGTGTMNLVRLTSLAPPTSVVPAGSETIGAGHSGSWFDPAQGGHGLMLEVLPGNQLFAAWFTYNPAGDQQVWFTGVGTYAGNRATISAIQPTGGRWIPNFDQSSVAINPWGTLTITFQDCTRGSVEFDSARGYGSGSMDLTRLTMPAGLACP